MMALTRRNLLKLVGALGIVLLGISFMVAVDYAINTGSGAEPYRDNPSYQKNLEEYLISHNAAILAVDLLILFMTGTAIIYALLYQRPDQRPSQI